MYKHNKTSGWNKSNGVQKFSLQQVRNWYRQQIFPVLFSDFFGLQVYRNQHF